MSLMSPCYRCPVTFEGKQLLVDRIVLVGMMPKNLRPKPAALLYDVGLSRPLNRNKVP